MDLKEKEKGHQIWRCHFFCLSLGGVVELGYFLFSFFLSLSPTSAIISVTVCLCTGHLPPPYMPTTNNLIFTRFNLFQLTGHVVTGIPPQPPLSLPFLEDSSWKSCPEDCPSLTSFPSPPPTFQIWLRSKIHHYRFRHGSERVGGCAGSRTSSVGTVGDLLQDHGWGKGGQTRQGIQLVQRWLDATTQKTFILHPLSPISKARELIQLQRRKEGKQLPAHSPSKTEPW